MLPSRWSPFRVSNIEHPKPGNLCIYQLTDNISLPSIPKLTMFLLSKREDTDIDRKYVTSRRSNVGVSIQDIVDVSGTERWKVYLSHILTDADFLSRYITYNKHCHTANCLTDPELGRLAEDSEQELLTKNAPLHN